MHAKHRNDPRAESGKCMVLCMTANELRCVTEFSNKLTMAGVGKKLGGCWYIRSAVGEDTA